MHGQKQDTLLPCRAGATPVRDICNRRGNGRDEARRAVPALLPLVRLLFHLAQGTRTDGLGIPDSLHKERRGRNRVRARQEHCHRRRISRHSAPKRMAPLPPQPEDRLERSIHRHRRQRSGADIRKAVLQRAADDCQGSAKRKVRQGNRGTGRGDTGQKRRTAILGRAEDHAAGGIAIHGAPKPNGADVIQRSHPPRKSAYRAPSRRSRGFRGAGKA